MRTNGHQYFRNRFVFLRAHSWLICLFVALAPNVSAQWPQFRGNHQLNTELWAQAVKVFGPEGALESTIVKGDYTMDAVMLNAVNQQLPPGRPALLHARR